MSIQALFSLTGKIALVTGASRGLGLAMARALAEAGALVYINSRNPEALQLAVKAAAADGVSLQPLAFDVEDSDAMAQGIAQLSAQHGGLDIVINNVGIRDRRGMFDLDAEAFQKMLNNHVVATFSLVRAVAPLMQARGGGRIINLLSVAAFRAAPNDSAYIAAKGALAALTRAQAVDLGKWNITVNALAPGAFITETNAALAATEQGRGMVASRTCLGRWGEVDEIAGAALFLASPSASYITGHILVVDGGVLAKY